MYKKCGENLPVQYGYILEMGNAKDQKNVSSWKLLYAEGNKEQSRNMPKGQGRYRVLMAAEMKFWRIMDLEP